MDKIPQLEDKITRLEARISHLEKKLESGFTAKEKLTNFETVKTDNEFTPTTINEKKESLLKEGCEFLKEDQSNPNESGWMKNFVDWIKKDIMLKIGAILLILALTWFVNYAFTQGWIGPVGRIALGMVAGTLIMAFGHFVIPKKPIPGQVLVTTGTTMILLTVFAARVFYDFFTPATSLMIMGLVIAMTTVIAIVRKAPAVAILALLGGGIAPLLTDSPPTDRIGLMSYIFLLDLGVLAVVSLRGWRFLILEALLITSIYSSVFDDMPLNPRLIFMVIFYLLFFISNIAAILKNKSIKISDLLATGITSVLAIAWTNDFIPTEFKSMVMSGITIVTVAFSYYLFTNLNTVKGAIYIYTGSAAAFLGAATAFELSGINLLIALSLEICALMAVSAYVLKDRKVLQVSAFLQIIPIFLSFSSRILSSYYWREEPLFNKYSIALMVVILSFAAGLNILKNFKDKDNNPVSGKIFIFFLLSLAFYCATFIWLTAHNLFQSVDQARSIALIIYSLIGISGYFQGVRKENKKWRVCAGIILGCVIVRLVFVEIWDMSVLGRVITFVVIGLMLVSTAFFEKNINLTSKK